MKKINELLGISNNDAEQLIIKLNHLLANYQMYYQNLRGFHWNVKGEKFFELHLKFEELYNDAVLKIDEIAERILTLGGIPAHSFSSYLKLALIKEEENVTHGPTGVEQTATSLALLIRLEKEILSLASKAGDEGTQTLLTDYVSQQEKELWMLAAYLNK